jgi:hypothetical protein
VKGLWIRNAKEVVMHAPDDVMQLMAHGNQNRMVAATSKLLYFPLFFPCLFYLKGGDRGRGNERGWGEDGD